MKPSHDLKASTVLKRQSDLKFRMIFYLELASTVKPRLTPSCKVVVSTFLQSVLFSFDTFPWSWTSLNLPGLFAHMLHTHECNKHTSLLSIY